MMKPEEYRSTVREIESVDPEQFVDELLKWKAELRDDNEEDIRELYILNTVLDTFFWCCNFFSADTRS